MAIQYSSSYEFQGPAGSLWRFNSDGSEYQSDSNHPFYYAADWNDFDTSYGVNVTDGGTTFLFGPQTDYKYVSPEYQAVSRQREVRVGEGFLRYLDTITNHGPVDLTYTYHSDNGFDHPEISTSPATLAEFYTNSSNLVDISTDWLVAGDTQGGANMLYGGVVLDGPKGLEPSSVVQTYDDLDYEFEFTLKPGESKSVLSFLTQGEQKADTLALTESLQALKGDALTGLTGDQLAGIVNFKVNANGPTQKGGAKADTLVGTELRDTLIGNGGNDLLSGMESKDTLHGGSGNDILNGGQGDDDLYGEANNDILHGGANDDRLFGNEGSDKLFGNAGNDSLFGDNNEGLEGLESTASQTTIPSSGQTLAISLTTKDATNDTSIQVEGFVAPDKVITNYANYNIAYVVDVSGSAGYTFQGAKSVPDLNNHGGANTILDAEIQGVTALHNSLVSTAGLQRANVGLIAFSGSASLAYTGQANADTDNNGTDDVIDALRNLTDTGSTDFSNALQAAIDFFEANPDRNNVLYFLSDGEDSSTDYIDEAQYLVSQNGLNAFVRAVGVGNDASVDNLDLVDDGIANNSATLTSDPSQLKADLKASGITKADVKNVKFFLNGKLVKTLLPANLAATPLGLKYSTTISGLKADASDTLKAVITASDADATTTSTRQIIEVFGGGAGDILSGGAGDDELWGADGKDLLIGGRGADQLSGGLAADTFRYLTPSQGGDTIEDFARSQGDKLQFRKDKFNFRYKGKLKAANFVANADGIANDKNDFFTFATSTNTLYFDKDGNRSGTRIKIATFDNGTTLKNTDIAII